MNRRLTRLTYTLIVCIAILFAAGACVLPGLGAAQPAASVPVDPAQETASALMTQAVMQTVVAFMSSTPPAAAENPAFATATLAPTSTPLTPTATSTRIPATNTPLPPTATPLPCNKALYIADLTVPDGEIMKAGTEVTKTWVLRNEGSCIWTEDFTVVQVGGSEMSAPLATNLDAVVLPGELAYVSVPLKLPEETGGHRAEFMLKTDTGALFGVGQNADKPFFIRVNIIKDGATPNEVYHFAKNYCEATWEAVSTSGDKVTLACPSVANPDGAVFVLNNPVLEGNRGEDEPTIISLPGNGKNGYIEGKFPAVGIKAGNRFQAYIGCLERSDDCSVTFKLLYSVDGGPEQELGSWPQIQDKKIKKLEIDLTPLAEKQVVFIFKVLNNGDSWEDRAFWFAPRITRK